MGKWPQRSQRSEWLTLRVHTVGATVGTLNTITPNSFALFLSNNPSSNSYGAVSWFSTARKAELSCILGDNSSVRNMYRHPVCHSNAYFTPQTRTRQNCLVLSCPRLRCELGITVSVCLSVCLSTLNKNTTDHKLLWLAMNTCYSEPVDIWPWPLTTKAKIRRTQRRLICIVYGVLNQRPATEL